MELGESFDGEVVTIDRGLGVVDLADEFTNSESIA